MSEPQGTKATEMQEKREPTWGEVMSYPLGVLGAAVGAACGALVVKWGAQAGFYAMVAVGVMAGLGASFFSRRGGWIVGIIAGIVALVTGVWAEWAFWGGMVADPSFGYFVRHLSELASFKLAFHAVGVVAAVWLGSRK